jgi:phytoene dehydrogenase-like protein
MATAQPLLQDPGSELEVAVGREHFRNGQVALTVHGSGEIDVVQLRSGAERDWHATFADDRLRALAAELAELDVAALRPRAGGRDPDDDPVRVALRAGGEPLHEAQLWHADRFADDRLDRLLTRWQALTEEVTDGALPYGEPR